VRLPGKGMSWKEFLTGLKDEISKDNITDLAATVTYYGVLALFPFLLFLVALATLFISPADAQRIVDELARVAPGPATQIVGERIQQLGQQQNVTLVGFGALGAIWAASGGVNALIRALNRTYDVQEGRPFWKVRGVAILMTLVSGALSLVAALVAVAAAPLADWFGGPIGTAIGWLRLPVAGLVMMLLWALLYFALPDVEQEFRFITPGSVVGVIVWVVASWAFSKYVTSFGSYDKTYGSLGGVIVLLLWMWISSLVLLFGAELNAFVEHRSEEGKRQGAKSTADKGLTPIAESPPVDEPVPARGTPPPHPASGGPVPVAVRERARPPVRGLVAIAAGLAAGVLIARREA
jgi:membrane protein